MHWKLNYQRNNKQTPESLWRTAILLFSVFFFTLYPLSSCPMFILVVPLLHMRSLLTSSHLLRTCSLFIFVCLPFLSFSLPFPSCIHVCLNLLGFFWVCKFSCAFCSCFHIKLLFRSTENRYLVLSRCSYTVLDEVSYGLLMLVIARKFQTVGSFKVHQSGCSFGNTKH